MHDSTQRAGQPGPDGSAGQEFYFVLQPAAAGDRRAPVSFGPFPTRAQAEVLRASAREFGLIGPH